MNESQERKHVKTIIVSRQASSELIIDRYLPERAEYATVLAISPFDGKEWEIRISHTRMAAISRRGTGYAYEAAYTVPGVLSSPTAVFKGVREDGEMDWLCYCGLPIAAYEIKTGREIRPYPNEVFLVYVNADRVAYNWRWEKCCPDNPELPQNHNTRFTERVL